MAARNVSDGKTVSTFQDAHHFVVNHLNVHNIGSFPTSTSQIAREVLEQHVVLGSAYDSAERSNAPKCHPETRKAVQENIMSWITHGTRRMMWLVGPAGCGKTAIAGSIAERCDEEGLLAGSFFFSSFAASADRCSKWGLWPRSRTRWVTSKDTRILGEKIWAAMERGGKQLLSKRLTTQMDRLILRPCREAVSIDPDSFKKRRVIIIDGLDEVLAAEVARKTDDAPLSSEERRRLDEMDQSDVLAILHQAIRDPSFPFLVLVASRPERVIRHFFSDKIHVELFLDGRFNPDDDIRLYLKCNFSELRRRYNLPSFWPSDESIERLVDQASGQFIYASTVVRFLRGGTIPPHLWLEHVLALRPKEEDFINPFAPLDALYSHILHCCPQPALAVQWIAHFQNRVSWAKFHYRTYYSHFDWVSFVILLLEEYPGQTAYLFENLASLIRMPPPGIAHLEPDQMYALQHKSLIDFLQDPHRCGEEFFNAYRAVNCHGYSNILTEGFIRVLEAQSTFTPLDTSWSKFACTLWKEALLYVAVCDRSKEFKLGDKMAEQQLQRLLTGIGYSHDGDWRFLGRLWSWVHRDCKRFHFRLSCEPFCTYWRNRLSGLLELCTGQVPNKMDLVIGQLIEEVVFDDGGRWPGFWYEFSNKALVWAPWTLAIPSPTAVAEHPAFHGECEDWYPKLLESANRVLEKISEVWDSDSSAAIRAATWDKKTMIPIVQALCRRPYDKGYIAKVIDEEEALRCRLYGESYRRCRLEVPFMTDEGDVPQDDHDTDEEEYFSCGSSLD